MGNSPGRLYANQYMGRIDHRFSEKDSLFGNFQLDSGISTWNTTPIDAQRMDTPSRNVSVGISETHIFSPGLVNEFRAGYVRWRLALDQEQDAQGAFTYQNTPFSLPSLYPTLFIGAYPSFGNGQAGNNSNDVEESWDFTDRLTYMHGRHQIKAGVEILRAHFYDVLNQNAFFLYADSLPPLFGFTNYAFSDFLLGFPFAGVTAQGTGKASMVERSVYAGYLQDDWKIHPRLTLNLGLRYEFAQAWHDSNTRLNRLGTLDVSAVSQSLGGRFLLGGSPNYYLPGQGVITGTGAPLIRGDLINPDHRDFQPRVGFAYRPFNNNKTAIRGGFGVYFAIPDADSLAFEMLSPHSTTLPSSSTCTPTSLSVNRY